MFLCRESSIKKCILKNLGGLRPLDPPMNVPPNSLVLMLIKYLKYKPMKYFSANQRNCLKELILLQLLVEYKLVSDLL